MNTALKDGANALEPDIRRQDKKLIVYHGFPDIYHSDKNLPIDDYFDKVHDIAQKTPALSLIALDIKPTAAAVDYGTHRSHGTRHHQLPGHSLEEPRTARVAHGEPRQRRERSGLVARFRADLQLQLAHAAEVQRHRVLHAVVQGLDSDRRQDRDAGHRALRVHRDR